MHGSRDREFVEASPAVVVTARGHVHFAGGLEVRRRGWELFVGYAGQSWASVDTRHPDGAGGRDSLGMFDDRGVVSSVVHASPRAVSVTLSGETFSLSADPRGHIAFAG